MTDDLKVVGKKFVAVDGGSMAEIVMEHEYTLAEAVAELVDNSIDAESTNVLIRFERSSSKLLRLLVIDNGRGITSSKIDEAMRFGKRRSYDSGDIGMYGIGMKSSSLSQAEVLSVISLARGGSVVGRRWTKDSSKKEELQTLDQKNCQEYFLNQKFLDFSIHEKGTIIRLDGLPDFFRSKTDGPDEYLKKAKKHMIDHLGLTFHRFLESKKRNRIQIQVDVYDVENDVHFGAVDIGPLNPFGYKKSGNARYPVDLQIRVPGAAAITGRAHIWPSDVNSPNYKLPGGARGKQGLYFYWKNRLIEAGGWNILADGDVHMSFARMEIDLKATDIGTLGITYTKRKIKAPQSFWDAVGHAQSIDKKFSYKTWRKDADKAYRARKKTEALKVFIPTPGKGIPAAVLEKFEKVVSDPGDYVDFEWASLPANKLFSISSVKRKITLNSLYRKNINGSLNSSGTDAALVKVLLLIALSDFVMTSRSTKNQKNREAVIQQLLVASVKTLKR